MKPTLLRIASRVAVTAVVLLTACGPAAQPASTESTGALAAAVPAAPASQRDRLTYEELMDREYTPDGPVHDSNYLPVGESTPAVHTFEGILTIPRGAVQTQALPGFEEALRTYPSLAGTSATWPGCSLPFFSHDGYLVPVERNVIECEHSAWGLIVDPGRVWSEPGDQGMSRASFPFVLISPDSCSSRSHNGVATFLYDGEGISALRLQITQENDPYLKFDMWGQIAASYDPGPVSGRETLAARFADELAQQVPVRPWTDLEARCDAELLDAFDGGLSAAEISATGLIVDGVLYLQSPMTRTGPYPYPRYMRHNVRSVTKSVGNGIAMLYLAQKYGDSIFEQSIVDTLTVTANHEGWEQVTLGDTLNMATGTGNGSHKRRPLDAYADTNVRHRPFWLARTASAKLDAAFSEENHPWGPGEVVRYVNQHAFVLSAALDATLKRKEGADVTLWEVLQREVFAPIGIAQLPMLHTLEQDGSPGIPVMALGLYPTVDDTAKIAMLLQNGGRQGDRQILSPTRLDEALYRSGVAGLPTGRHFDVGDEAYHMSFWGQPYRTRDGRTFQVPYMAGDGGNVVVLAPNGISAFRYTDANLHDVAPLIRVAEGVRSFPGQGIDAGWLAPKGVWLVPGHWWLALASQQLLVGWLALTLGSLAYLAWRLARGRGHAWGSKLAWGLITLCLGPLGLLAYLTSPGTQPRHASDPDTGYATAAVWWRKGLGAAAYSASGYTLALLLVVAYFSYVQPRAGLAPILGILYLVPLVVGLLAVRAPAAASHLGIGYGRAVRKVALTEFVSANVGFAAMFPVLLGCRWHWFPGPLEMLHPRFALMMLLATLAGALILTPYNVWLARRGCSAWPDCMTRKGHDTWGEHAEGLLTWRNAWGALLLCLALLAGSMGLTFGILA